jgi:hypothetical protein
MIMIVEAIRDQLNLGARARACASKAMAQTSTHIANAVYMRMYMCMVVTVKATKANSAQRGSADQFHK